MNQLKTKLRLVLMFTFLVTRNASIVGYRECLTRRGIELAQLLSLDDTNPLFYFYEYNTTSTVSTASTTSVSFNHWLWVRLIPELSTHDEKQFQIVILNRTDYKGNEEQLFNNSHLKHQLVFQICRDVRTGLVTSIRISNELQPSGL